MNQQLTTSSRLVFEDFSSNEEPFPVKIYNLLSVYIYRLSVYEHRSSAFFAEQVKWRLISSNIVFGS